MIEEERSARVLGGRRADGHTARGSRVLAAPPLSFHLVSGLNRSPRSPFGGGGALNGKGTSPTRLPEQGESGHWMERVSLV